MELIAFKGFNEPNAEGGYQKRGRPWTGTDARAKELQLLGLIGPATTAQKSAATPSNKMAPAPDNKSGATAPKDGVALVRQNADKAIAAVAAVTDRRMLVAAHAAESAKGAKARDRVIAAIDAALAAAPAAEE